MKTVKIIHFVRNVSPLYFYSYSKQETGNEVICLVTNTRRILSVEGKVKVIRKYKMEKRKPTLLEISSGKFYDPKHLETHNQNY